MATLSDLKEVKEALDAGLVSQADFDDVKRDYLRAKKEALEANKEFQKKELRAKEEALEFQKMELLAKKEALEANKESQKRELIAKEEFQKRKLDAELRAFALEVTVKHGSSPMSEEQKVGLVRDYVKMFGLDGSAEKDRPSSKRQRPGAEERNAVPPLPSTLPTAPAAVALPPPADASTQSAPDRVPAPAPAPAHGPSPAAANETSAPALAGASTRGVGADTTAARSIFQSNLIALNEYLDKNADIMSEEQKASLKCDYAKMFGLEGDRERIGPSPYWKRHRALAEERDASPPQPSTPSLEPAPAPAAHRITPHPWGQWTCKKAAENGHLDALKWLRSQDPPCPWSEWTCTYAAVNSYLDVLKFLVDNGCPYDVNRGCKSAYEKLGLA